ncbi:MAG: DUF192 domain-containing protein [Bacteriovorax sp.]
MTTISQNTLKRNLILIAIAAMGSSFAWGKDHFLMKSPYGNAVELKLALTRAENTKGLSGLKSNEFKDSMGMLFVNSEMGLRRFWMPDTYFNLDIIFLDQNLKIVGVEKNVPAHPGMSEPPAIYKTETYSAQFILETKAGALFGKKLKKNDQLKFTGPTSLSEIALKTRQMQ